MSLGVFDPLLGRLRSDDTVTINTVRNVTQGMGAAPATGGASVQIGITVPSNGSDGDIFYDTDDAILYVYANGMWNAISGGGGGPVDPGTLVSNLILQAGDDILTQDGSFLLTQAQ